MNDFYSIYEYPARQESDLLDYPIFCIENWKEEFSPYYNEILRFIVYRYNPASPVYLKRVTSKREEEAKIRSNLPEEIYEQFVSGNDFLSSLVLGYLAHIRDYDWTQYILIGKSYNNVQKNIMLYENLDMKGKDVVSTTKDMTEMTTQLQILGSELKKLESTLFDFNKRDDDTAISIHLRKYAPKVIDGVKVDLIKNPTEYFAVDTVDTFVNKGVPKSRKPKKLKEELNESEENENEDIETGEDYQIEDTEGEEDSEGEA